MSRTRRWGVLSVALVLLMVFTPVLAGEVYPVEGKPELTIWTTVDSDLSLFGYSSYQDAPGFQTWQEATGISATIVESADVTALLLKLATGELPDIIRGTKEFYSKGFEAMISEGLAIDLGEYLPEYAPNYWAYLQSSDNIYKSAAVDVDGELKIISFAGNFYPESSPYRNYGGVMVRKDFMEKLGIEKITTVDDLYTFLSRCKSELGVPTPLMSQNTLNEYIWNYGYFTSAFGVASAVGYQVDGTYHFGAYEKEFKDFLAFMHKLYAEGLFDPNFTVTDNSTAIAAMSNGTSAAISCLVSRFQVVLTATQDPELDLVAIPSLTANDGERAMLGFASTLSSPSAWAFVTEECKDIEAALRFLDYPFSPKGLDLANYGVEGETYTYDADGKAQLTEFVTKNPDGYAIDPILRAYGLVNWPTIHRQEFSEKRFPLQQQRDACVTWADNDHMKYMISYYSVPTELQEEYTRLWTDIDTYLREMIANFISGTEPLDNFDAFQATLKNQNIERYMEIMQLAIDPYYE